MNEAYEYRAIRIERGAWAKVTEAVYGSVAAAVRAAGGVVFGLWRGEIGWYTDEGALMTAWPETPDHSAADGIPGVVELAVERVVATVRPITTSPPTEDGVYAHRWFELNSSDWPSFLQLSQGAWPEFEPAFEGVRIVGFWRSLDVAPPKARVLLITRYPSLDVWERSRPYGAQRAPGPEGARALFGRRAELTERTIVRIARLLRPS